MTANGSIAQLSHHVQYGPRRAIFAFVLMDNHFHLSRCEPRVGTSQPLCNAY